MVKYIKPENMYQFTSDILTAKKVLFPEFWQVNTLIYAFKKEIFPSPSTYHLGHNKIEMTRAFEAYCPEFLPKTKIYASNAVYFENIVDEFGLPFVCKEVNNSSGFGVYLINSKEDFHFFKRDNAIVYIQEYLKIDRDLRVVIIGDKVVDSYWRIKDSDSFHCNIAQGGSVSKEIVPEDAVSTVLNIASHLGVNYAGFDVVLTETGLKIFEFNLYFGTKGISLNSVDLGNRIYEYLNIDNVQISFNPEKVKIGNGLRERCYLTAPNEIKTVDC